MPVTCDLSSGCLRVEKESISYRDYLGDSILSFNVSEYVEKVPIIDLMSENRARETFSISWALEATYTLDHAPWFLSPSPSNRKLEHPI